MALVARYRLNGNIQDSSGNTYHGTTVAGGLEYLAGKLGLCGNVTGDDKINLPTTMLPVGNEISISVWLKTPTMLSSSLLCAMNSAGTYILNIHPRFNPEIIYFDAGSSGGTSDYDRLSFPYVPAKMDGWHHWVFWKDAKKGLMRVYIDGTLYIEATGKTQSFIVPSNFGLFYNPSATDVYKHIGQVEDLRIYDHALSTKEIKELAKAKILHLAFDNYEEPTTNLIPDGNFSRKTFQLPYLNAGFNNATAAFVDGDSSTPCKGNVLELTSTGGDSYMSPYSGLGSKVATVVAGEVYTLSFFSKAKSSPTCKPGFYIFFLDANGVFDSNSMRQNYTVGMNWTKNECTFTIPAGKVGLSIRIENQESGTTAQFNGLQLEKKPYATPFSDGTRYKTNLHADAYNIYNNFGMAASLVATGEYYLGEKVYRLTMTPSTQAMVDSMKVNFFNHGIFATSMTFLANTKYATSCLWRPVNKPDTIVGGAASNITGFVEGPREKFKDGWNRYNRYRVGEATDKSDVVHISMISPSMVLGDSLIVDFCGLRTEKDTTYCSKYSNGIIEDKSDFGNHVNITDVATAVPFTADSKLGDQALNFDGRMRPIAFSKIVPGCLTNCTVAFWRKSSNAGYELILNERDSRLGETLDGYFMACAGAPFYSQTSKVTGNQNLYIDGVLKSGAEKTFINDGNWHHYVMSGVNLSLFTKLMMNTYSVPGVFGANDWHMKSTIDDFRIYATELSQADVLELYKVRASIDKLGNISAHKIEQNDVDDGLIAYYPLNGDVLDHKNNYDGVIGSGTSYAAGLKDRKGIKVIAASDYITFPTLPVLPKEKTLSFWIKSDRPLSANDDLWIGYFNISDSTPGGKFGMMYGVGQCQDFGFWGYSNDASIESISNKWSSDGNWHHVAVTEDIDRKIKIYVDGIQKKIVSHSADTTKIDFVTLQSDTIASNIFSIKTYTGQAWTGMTYCQIQDVRVYNKAISSDIITKLYNWSHEKFSISKKGIVRANKISTRGVTDRLIAHWPLDGDTKDYVGGFNGTPTDISYSAGVNQKSAVFNGTTGRILTNLTRGALKNNYSISAWIKYSGAISDNYRAFIGGNDAATEFFLGKDNGTSNLGWQDGDYFNNAVVGSDLFTSGIWKNVVVARSGNIGTIYIDGVLVGTKTFTTSCNDVEKITIGCETEGTGFYWKGQIQDVKIYIKALSPAEIKLNYNLTKADRIPYSISKDGILYVRNSKEGL